MVAMKAQTCFDVMHCSMNVPSCDMMKFLICLIEREEKRMSDWFRKKINNAHSEIVAKSVKNNLFKANNPFSGHNYA
ncbi:unnamed protein product [Sphenostylis stenocarpa]|uniref:Uncharacterized protein n=1 Tax=Sphenostylis stenocarpa TaxID=92480 RepID=A0AA86SKT5_9FABA|nr:unnamed protein product [Sphenostylis stenocarpa]